MTSVLQDPKIRGQDLRDCIWFGLEDVTSKLGFWDHGFRIETLLGFRNGTSESGSRG